MLFVSFTEVILVFGRLLLGAITFQNSQVQPLPPLLPANRDCRFLAPLFFAHFLRLRYYLSPPTRQAFAWVSSQVDSGIGHPSCPAPVKQVVNIIRDLVRPLLPLPPSLPCLLIKGNRLFDIAKRYSRYRMLLRLLRPQRPHRLLLRARWGEGLVGMLLLDRESWIFL